MAYFDKYGVEFSDDRKTLVHCPEDLRGEYVIPDGTTCIGWHAFEGCSSITAISIPHSVARIEELAFSYCTKLKSIEIPDSVIDFNGSNPFYCCDSLIDPVFNTHSFIHLPTSYIGEYIVPEGIENIVCSAFIDCTKLTSVIIPDSVNSIGENAFSDCTNLNSVRLPNELTTIERDLFSGCMALSSIDIPKTTNTIKLCAFNQCRLQAINIPNSAYLCYCSLWCGDLNGIIIENREGGQYINNCLIRANKEFEGEFSVPEGTISIGREAFKECKSITSILLPQSIKYIGKLAFSGCEKLRSINIPDSAKYIGEEAFVDCAELEMLSFPDHVTHFDGEAISTHELSKCKKLRSVHLPLKFLLKKFAFDGFSELEHINIPMGVEKIPTACFQECINLKNIILPDSLQEIEDYAFFGCHKLSNITIPKNVKSIGDYAFYECNIESITIGPNIESIGAEFDRDLTLEIHFTGTLEEWCNKKWDTRLLSGTDNFYSFTHGREGDIHLYIGNKKVTNIIIPKSIIGIKEGTFFQCIDITSITIHDNVTVIGEGAFYGCSGLTSITIPNSVTSIGEWAFSKCESLQEIIVPKGQKGRFSLMRGLNGVEDKIIERDNEELTILINLAKAYEKGIGVSQSIAQALITYIQAAEKGSAEAAYHMGEWYWKGKNVPIDKQKALAYFQQAAKSGFLDAQQQAEEIQNEIEEQQRQEQERLRNEGEAQRIAEQKLEEARKSAERNADPYYLFFDTETTGLPRSMKASVCVTENWPRLVQLAWLLVTKNGDVIKKRSAIIYPDDFVIPEEASMIHGITTERARREGKPLATIIDEFMQDFENVICLVAHNIEFDQNIIGAELCRLNRSYDSFMYHKETICTMLSSTDYCAIPSINGHEDYKWPKLQELYHKLFNKYFDDAHDALADITATKECFFELKKRRII